MIRWIALGILSVSLCGAQSLKILVAGQSAETIADWQSASSKVKLVQVNSDNAMVEIADADAYIGNISPELVSAGQNLRWGANPERRSRAGAPQVRVRRSGE